MSPERIAPERFGLKNSRPTIPSDCYALGMVVYETVSGNVPFHKDTDLTVSMKVVEGKHPHRGVKFTAGLWEMLERCWVPTPNDRPSIEDVLRCLEMAPNLLEPPSPRTDEEIDEDGDWDSATISSGGDSVDLFATNDRVQLSPMDSLRDHHFSRGRTETTSVRITDKDEGRENVHGQHTLQPPEISAVGDAAVHTDSTEPRYCYCNTASQGAVRVVSLSSAFLKLTTYRRWYNVME